MLKQLLAKVGKETTAIVSIADTDCFFEQELQFVSTEDGWEVFIRDGKNKWIFVGTTNKKTGFVKA